jgi:hypothetical protein
MSNVPALQRQIFDLLDEYDAKNAAADSAVEALEAAAGNMRLASAVAGQYARTVVEFRHGGPSPNDVRRNLLLTAWKAAYSMIQIDRIASATDKARR